MNYNKKFVQKCKELYEKILQNNTIQECLNTAATAASVCDSAIDIYEPLWFIYYMFFAIHNPKMEDYIQKKSTTTTTTEEGAKRNPADILKNMLKRRNYTSTIVFQLYTHAYTDEGNVTHIYPKYKNNLTAQLIHSFQNNHLKTTAVLLRKHQANSTTTAATTTLVSFIEYIITTQPTNTSDAIAIINKLNNDINYKRKDIILLALVCYMKTDEEDINKKNIFIAATNEELNECATTPPPTQP